MHLKIQIHLKSRKWASGTICVVVSLLMARAFANEVESARKCVPVLNFARNSLQSNQQQERENVTTGMPNEFTFNIGDIDMPLSQTGSSMHTAMKLLAAFDSQLYGFGGGGGGDDDDYNYATTRAPPKENSITFERNKLHISGLNLTMLNVHLYEHEEPKFALGLQISNTTLEGQFHYSGLAPSALMGVGELYSQLVGHYRMSIDNVLVMASSNLTKHKEAQQDEYSLRTNEFKMELSNLGYITIEIRDSEDSAQPTSNYMLKMLERVLQKTIKRTYGKFEAYIRATLETEGRRFLDCELTRFTPTLIEKNRDQIQLAETTLHNTTSLDDLARIISAELARSQLTQVSLPNFQHQRSVLGSNALIEFSNGTLSGLDNVRLNGETKIKLQDSHLLVNASIGWANLRPHYNWTLYLGSSAIAQRRQELNTTTTTTTTTTAAAAAAKPMARGFVAFNIKQVDFDALISRSLSSSSRLTVDSLEIRRLDGPKMDIGGLPGVNRLARGVVNFFMGRLKQRLVGSIQPALKQELERVLNRLTQH